ncbi:MAG: hypothetical protein AAGA96_04140 [Verrucomicrobiota bacterium]
MNLNLLWRTIILLWAISLTACSESTPDQAKPTNSTEGTEDPIAEAKIATTETPDSQSNLQERLEESLPRAVQAVPGSLKLEGSIQGGNYSGPFQVDVKTTETTYNEVPTTLVLETLNVPADQVDAVEFALNGISVIDTVEEEGAPSAVSGFVTAQNHGENWSVDEVEISPESGPAGSLRSEFAGKTIELRSEELKVLVGRIKDHSSASEVPYQTSQLRETARVKALEEMKRLKNEGAAGGQ